MSLLHDVVWRALVIPALLDVPSDEIALQSVYCAVIRPLRCRQALRAASVGNKASTKSFATKGCRSATVSPTPTNLMGMPSSSTTLMTAPPRAVPSSCEVTATFLMITTFSYKVVHKLTHQVGAFIHAVTEVTLPQAKRYTDIFGHVNREVCTFVSTRPVSLTKLLNSRA